jgi:hypothetical protein
MREAVRILNLPADATDPGPDTGVRMAAKPAPATSTTRIQ